MYALYPNCSHRLIISKLIGTVRWFDASRVESAWDGHRCKMGKVRDKNTKMAELSRCTILLDGKTTLGVLVINHLEGKISHLPMLRWIWECEEHRSPSQTCKKTTMAMSSYTQHLKVAKHSSTFTDHPPQIASKELLRRCIDRKSSENHSPPAWVQLHPMSIPNWWSIWPTNQFINTKTHIKNHIKECNTRGPDLKDMMVTFL